MNSYLLALSRNITCSSTRITYTTFPDTEEFTTPQTSFAVPAQHWAHLLSNLVWCVSKYPGGQAYRAIPPVQPFSRKPNNFAGYNGILKSFTSVEYLFEIPETLKSRSGVRLSARLCKAWIQIARRVKFPRLQAIGKNMLTILLGEIQEGGGRLGKPELLYTAGAHHAASKSIILGCQAQANYFKC